MWNKLQPREKRILKLLFLTAAVIVGFMLIEPLVKDFQHTRAERLELKKTLDTFLGTQDDKAARQKAVAERVPVFEPPTDGPQQSILFRDELTRQLQRCGLTSKSMQLRQDKTKKTTGSNVWVMECQGQCQYASVLQFLEEIKKNPYYAAIEKLVLKADTKDRNKMTYHLTVSTYAL